MALCLLIRSKRGVCRTRFGVSCAKKWLFLTPESLFVDEAIFQIAFLALPMSYCESIADRIRTDYPERILQPCKRRSRDATIRTHAGDFSRNPNARGAVPY